MSLLKSPGQQTPLLRGGIGMALVLWMLFMLQGTGLQFGSVSSVLTMALTCLGLSMGWGYLMAGATAGGWIARAVVAVGFLAYLYPSWAAMTRGFAGIVLLLGLVIYLIWRWREQESEPRADLLVTGVIMILVYGLVAERTILSDGRIAGGENLFALSLSLQAITATYLTGTIMLLVGGSIGEMMVRGAGAAAGRLTRLPAGVLMGILTLVAAGKVVWDLTRYTGPAWFTSVLLFGLFGAWAWFTRPRGAWSLRHPLVVLLVAQVFILLTNLPGIFPEASSSAFVFVASLYVAGVVGLLVGVGALLRGQRTVALYAGLIGIWLLIAAGNGEVQVPFPVLSWLIHLPQTEAPAVDGGLYLMLLAWAGWLWFRGRRDAGPYALILAGMLAGLLITVLDWIYLDPALKASLIPLAIFGLSSLYVLWQVVQGARGREGSGAVAWTGLAVGGAILLFASGYWAQLTDIRAMYDPAGSPYLGYAMFSLVTFIYGLLRLVSQMTEERGEEA